MPCYIDPGTCHKKVLLRILLRKFQDFISFLFQELILLAKQIQTDLDASFR